MKCRVIFAAILVVGSAHAMRKESSQDQLVRVVGKIVCAHDKELMKPFPDGQKPEVGALVACWHTPVKDWVYAQVAYPVFQGLLPVSIELKKGTTESKGMVQLMAQIRALPLPYE